MNNITLSSSRLTRWRLKLAEYNFKIIYKKGSINTNADALSRVDKQNTKTICREDLIENLLSINEKAKQDKIKYKDENITTAHEPIVLAIAKHTTKHDDIIKFVNKNFDGLTPPKRHNKRVGECIRKVNKDGRIIIYLIVRSSNDKPSLNTVDKCLKNLEKECKINRLNKLAFPKMFNSLGWNNISTKINEILIQNGIECEVYLNKEVKLESLNEVHDTDEMKINDKLAKLQKEDDEIQELIKMVRNRKLNGYCLEDGILFKYRKNRTGKRFKQLVVPTVLRKDVLELCHDNFTGAHLGQKKTWIKLSNRFYWPNSYKETKNYVESCKICAKIKEPQANRAQLKPITNFEKPFDMIAVDILELSRSSSGNKYVVVFTDYLTKWVEAFAINDMKAETIAKFFINEIITRHSTPSKLLSDQGKNFLSNLVKSVCEYFKINKVQTTPYHPQCDGLVERFNKTLCKMLSAYANSNQTNWDLYLPLVLFAYRTAEQSSSGFSPFNLLYGREPRLGDLDNYNIGYEPSEFIKDLHTNWMLAKNRIDKQAEINKKIYDSKYKQKPTTYNVGDEVRVKVPQTKIGLKKKLRNDLWSEPLKITKVISEQNIEVVDKNRKKVINVNNVKLKEAERICDLEKIRNQVTVTKSGRMSKPRFHNP